MHILTYYHPSKSNHGNILEMDRLLLLFQREINKKIIKRKNVRKSKREIDTKGEERSERK
jgi:hypothetical protein